jgi:hypothetical protein
MYGVKLNSRDTLMSEDFKLSKITFLFRMTQDEREVIRQLGKLEGSESNAIRRAIRLLMEARGLEIPEGLFVDREAGNRLPKNVALPTRKIYSATA